MPENQLANRTHACVYVRDKEGRVNVARSVSTSDTRHESAGLVRVITDGDRRSVEIAGMCVFVGARQRGRGRYECWTYM